MPFWVVITCQAALAIGTLFGGWRIVHTMGSRITRLNPMQGFCAETGGAITLSGDLAGRSGLHHPHHHRRHHRRRRGAPRAAVRWGIAGNIVFAWVVASRRPRSLLQSSMG